MAYLVYVIICIYEIVQSRIFHMSTSTSYF